MISTLNTGARYFSLILLCSGPLVGLKRTHSLSQPQPVPPLLTVPPDPTLLGNHRRPTPAHQARRADRLRQLRVLGLALVHAVLLPALAGAALRDGRRRHHCRHGLTILSCLWLRWWCMRKNRKIEEQETRTSEVTTWRYAT